METSFLDNVSFLRSISSRIKPITLALSLEKYLFAKLLEK